MRPRPVIVGFVAFGLHELNDGCLDIFIDNRLCSSVGVLLTTPSNCQSKMKPLNGQVASSWPLHELQDGCRQSVAR